MDGTGLRGEYLQAVDPPSVRLALTLEYPGVVGQLIRRRDGDRRLLKHVKTWTADPVSEDEIKQYSLPSLMKQTLSSHDVGAPTCRGLRAPTCR